MRVPATAPAILMLALAVSGCAALLGERAARRAGLVRDRAPEAAAPDPDPDADLHPVILAYRESLRPFLGEEEAAALDALDWSGTAEGDAQRLRYLAADHAIRRVLPIVLESEGDPILAQHAARLRALPPLLNRDTDVIAQRAVLDARRALDRARRGERPEPPHPIALGAGGESGEGHPLAGALAALPSEPTETRDADADAELAGALAEYAVAYSRTHGVSALQGAAAAAAAADAMDVAFLLGRAMQSAPARPRLVDEAIALGQELVSAARRRERLPRLHRDEPRSTR